MRVSRHFLYTTSIIAVLGFAGAGIAKAEPKAAAATPAAQKSELATALDSFSTENFPELTAGGFGYALLHGTPWINARYRYEYVDQAGLTKNANASTLRTKIGYKTGLWQGFQLGVEGENIVSVGLDRYNSTTNGKKKFPIVSDPEDTGLNQLYLSYQGLPKTNITVGRQLINLDNQRFVGAVDWRQNDQTFDAATISSQYIEGANFYYAYVSKVNRITGPNATNGTYDSNSHLINASYEFDPAFKATIYDYMLDFDDAHSLSSVTYGARFTGKYAASSDINLLYAAEAANQKDYGHNSSSFSSNYYLLEPAIAWNGFTVKLGYEVLEGDGIASHAFQTPIATLHAFNGWADKFLTTPANGLEDRYVSLAYKVPFGDEWLKGTDIVVAYHDFQANHTNTNYGTEWNASVQQTFNDHYTVGIKFDDYNADKLFTDTQKIILTLQVKY
ncbi:MAG: alginate export family protein [Alphaproteobacteria bacterium]